MKMYEGFVAGLRLISEDQSYLFDVTFFTYQDYGKWITKELYDDEQILGVEVNKNIEDSTIQMAWILGSPNAKSQACGGGVAYDTNGSWRPKILKPISFG